MSIKLLFFFTFCLFPKIYYSQDNIQSFLQLIKNRVIQFNEKNPKVLTEAEKSILSFVIKFQICHYRAFEENIKKDLKNKPDFIWNSYFQPALKDLCIEINKNLKHKNTNKQLKDLNDDLFTKQINEIIEKHKKKPLVFNYEAIWKRYQLLLLKILIADFFKVDCSSEIEMPSINDSVFIVQSVLQTSKKTLYNIDQENKIPQFLGDYLVQFAIDWTSITNHTITKDNIKFENLPWSPMANDKFVELLKDNPVDLSNITINPTTGDLKVPDQKQEKRTFLNTLCVITGVLVFAKLLFDFFQKNPHSSTKHVQKALVQLINQNQNNVDQLKQKTH